MTLVKEMFSAALTPKSTLHGVLVEVFGVGVLILGDSGVGKSRSAIDLISRGHKLVSDDSVEISKIAGRLIGKCPESIRDLIEIHGRGIVNARLLFGISSLAESAEIFFCIELFDLRNSPEGLLSNWKAAEITILGNTIPRYLVNVISGCDFTTSVETVARAAAVSRNPTCGMESVDSNVEPLTI